MMRLLYPWRAARNRVVRQAERASQIDRLGDPAANPPGRLSPWEEIFARPEWRQTAPVGRHDGHCSHCGASPPQNVVICGACGWVWRPRLRLVGWAAQVRFWAAATAASVILSIGGTRLLSWLASSWYIERYPDRPVDEGFVGFVDAYCMVSGVMLLLLLATIVLERLGRFAWRPPERAG